MEMAVESMEIDPGAIPRSGRVPEQRLSVPRISSAMATALRDFSWNCDQIVRVFSSGGIYRRKGVARRCTWAPHRARRGLGGTAPRAMCGYPVGLLRLPFGLLCWHGKIVNFGLRGFQFREYFLWWISETKNSIKQELALRQLVNRLVPAENA